MKVYKTFWVDADNSEFSDEKVTKSFDISKVESWEYITGYTTGIVMDSGDRFVIHFNCIEFGNIMFSYQDTYGQLFMFNRN